MDDATAAATAAVVVAVVVVVTGKVAQRNAIFIPGKGGTPESVVDVGGGVRGSR